MKGHFLFADDDKPQHAEKNKQEEINTPYNLANFCWLVVSIATFYYTDFALAVLYDPRVHRLGLPIKASSLKWLVKSLNA